MRVMGKWYRANVHVNVLRTDDFFILGLFLTIDFGFGILILFSLSFDQICCLLKDANRHIEYAFRPFGS